MILRYKWDTGFNFWSFEKHIRSSNATEICNWQASDIFGRLDPYSDFCEELEFNQSRYRRIVSTPTVDALLSRKNDLMLQVFLPPKFADYASNLVRQAQVQAGLPQTQLLIPIERDSDTEVTRKEGLFFWRIGKDLMWQQIDRHIDEVFRILSVFRSVNKHLRFGDAYDASLFRAELGRREASDEFDAFARWVQGESLAS